MVPKLLAQMHQFVGFAQSLDGKIEAKIFHIVDNEAAEHKHNY